MDLEGDMMGSCHLPLRSDGVVLHGSSSPGRLGSSLLIPLGCEGQVLRGIPKKNGKS